MKKFSQLILYALNIHAKVQSSPKLECIGQSIWTRVILFVANPHIQQFRLDRRFHGVRQ